MNTQLLSKKLLEELDEIKVQNDNTLERAWRSIKACRKLLTTYKNEIINKDFKTAKEEIQFFKLTKQIPLTKLIYFSEIHSFEIQFPKGDKDFQLKFIKKKIKKINRFFIYNIDFGRYINSGATHFDKEYYTRDYLETFHITTSKFYFQDPDFCTPRDMLLGKYKAYDVLVTYLNEKKYKVHKGLNGRLKSLEAIEKIHWPFSNTDYVELLYSLYSRGLGKQNNQSLNQVSKKLEQVFDFTPKDIYKTYHDIKNRKNSRTLFLDQLSTSLLMEMDKSEE
ncbi:MAG: RteC domain-containing protein [Ignavibacteriae bacterium]|nr:RteC domain-containing protein [Ignavibacteriota bacterium]